MDYNNHLFLNCIWLRENEIVCNEGNIIFYNKKMDLTLELSMNLSNVLKNIKSEDDKVTDIFECSQFKNDNLVKSMLGKRIKFDPYEAPF